MGGHWAELRAAIDRQNTLLILVAELLRQVAALEQQMRDQQGR